MNLVIANLYFSQYEQNCKGNDGFLTPSKLLTYVPDYFTTCSLYGNWLVMIVFFMDYSIQMFFSTNQCIYLISFHLWGTVEPLDFQLYRANILWQITVKYLIFWRKT